jgi:hypothetical protein
MRKSLVNGYDLRILDGKVKRVVRVGIVTDGARKSGWTRVGALTSQWGSANDLCVQEEFVQFPVMYPNVPSVVQVSTGYISDITRYGFRWIRELSLEPSLWFSAGLSPS